MDRDLVDRAQRAARARPRAGARGLGTDVVVARHAPTEVRGPFGLRIGARRLALSIDDIDGFLAAAAPHLLPTTP